MWKRAQTLNTVDFVTINAQQTHCVSMVPVSVRVGILSCAMEPALPVTAPVVQTNPPAVVEPVPIYKPTATTVALVIIFVYQVRPAPMVFVLGSKLAKRTISDVVVFAPTLAITLNTAGLATTHARASRLVRAPVALTHVITVRSIVVALVFI